MWCVYTCVFERCVCVHTVLPPQRRFKKQGNTHSRVIVLLTRLPSVMAPSGASSDMSANPKDTKSMMLPRATRMSPKIHMGEARTLLPSSVPVCPSFWMLIPMLDMEQPIKDRITPIDQLGIMLVNSRSSKQLQTGLLREQGFARSSDYLLVFNLLLCNFFTDRTCGPGGNFVKIIKIRTHTDTSNDQKSTKMDMVPQSKSDPMGSRSQIDTTVAQRRKGNLEFLKYQLMF